MNDLSSGSKRDKPQLSIRALLLVTASVGVYVTVALTVVRNHGKLLDVVMDAAGPWAFGCGLFTLIGLGMMAANIALGQTGYLWPSGLLVTALAYAAANVVVFIATLMVDAYAIFDEVYSISAVLVGPAIMLVALVIVAGFVKRLGWLGVVGFTIWIECVAFAHLWIIAAAAQTV